MKKNKRSLLFIAFIACIISSCYYDTEEELYPSTNNCVVGVVTFSTTINGLLNSYGCLGCHIGTAPSGNFSLQGYTNVKAKINDGRLWGAINHHAGFAPMPDGAAKMNQCDINKIKAWIDAGAPNN